MAGDALQKFKSSLNRGVTTISVKASSSLEKGKIKTHIESINSEIQKLITTIGETAYASWESGGDFSSLAELCAQIQQKKGEIEQLNQEMASIDERDSQILGAKAAESASAAPASAEPGTVCPSCGTQFDSPVKFCRKCGQKLL